MARRRLWVRSNEQTDDTATKTAREVIRAAKTAPISQMTPEQRLVIAASQQAIARRDRHDRVAKNRKKMSRKSRRKNR